MSVRRIAVFSMHTSPLAQPGTGDGGGMNVYVRALASALARAGVQCDVYTRAVHRMQAPVVEVLPGFDVQLWLGLLAPAGTPRPIVDRLASATAEALQSPDVKSALAAQDFTPLSGTPEQFAAFYQSEVEKWRKFILKTGMSID